MGVDNPPSFSLGITQLDATVQDIPLGFFPATFDEQDPDWAENRSKHRNDPVTMKKLTDKTTSKSKKSTSKASKKKFDDSGRPRLPKIFTMSGMKYRIDKVPPHPLHVGSLCNYAFGEEIKEYFRENVLGAFRNIIFGIFLDLPRCNWIGQISKCLLMLEIQQNNKDELHVWNGNFDKAEDALNLAILFFVHIFMFSQHKEAPISVAHFQIIEDGRYIHFPWGKCIRPKYESFMSGMFTKPVSPDQPLKKRKIVMFDQEKQTVMDDDTFECGHAVHHGSDLYCETHKDTIDKKKIGVSEIQHHHHVEIDVSPQSHQHKSVPSSSKQPEGTSKPSLDDVNAADKEAGREDNFENEDCSDLQALEDEIMEYEEEYSDEDLGKKNIPDVEDLSDEVGGTRTNSIQSAVDTLLFGLSTPSTTKSLDVGASNKMTERHWDLPDSQIPPDFPDAQVRELQASKSKAPAKRERKKSRILRSPYISKNGSSFKDAVDIDKEEKLKYVFDGYNINQDFPNELMIDYSQ
ncbi:hypothetical protein BC332_05728 [Capsicum chinense]|nr:hypothetical protein BC332_05728 [Capsicum chinense]